MAQPGGARRRAKPSQQLLTDFFAMGDASEPCPKYAGGRVQELRAASESVAHLKTRRAVTGHKVALAIEDKVRVRGRTL